MKSRKKQFVLMGFVTLVAMISPSQIDLIVVAVLANLIVETFCQ